MVQFQESCGIYIYILKRGFETFHDNLITFTSNISFSIYVTKQSSIHWSPIRLRNYFFMNFIIEKAISIVTVVTGRIDNSFTSK